MLFAGICFIALSAFVSQRFWRENGLHALQAVNEQRVQLVANAIKAEVSRQDHLPVVLSLDADVGNALAARNDPEQIRNLNQKLARVSVEADTRALYIISPQGIVVGSDDWESPTRRLNLDYSGAAYFTEAIRTGKSSFLGVPPDSDRVRYFLAHSIQGRGVILGISVVRIEFDSIEEAWSLAGEHVFATDATDTIFLASDADYRFRQLGPAAATPETELRYSGRLKEPLNLNVVEQRGSSAIVRIRSSDGEETDYLYQRMTLPQYNWTVHRLTDLDSIHADQRDGAIIGGAISTLFIFLLLYLLSRHRAYLQAREAGRVLAEQVTERTRELSDTNRSLQVEIEERRRAAAQLRSTQNELVQAGKLAAVGQMSAALAHEINQPLAAIRTFIASTKIFAQRNNYVQVSTNLDLISDLAERMAGLTSHLKTFARKSDHGKPAPVDVERAINGALFLIDGQIRGTRVSVEKRIAPNLLVSGYPVQLEQVIVNLVLNALDAVAKVDDPVIEIDARALNDNVEITVQDNGTGIAAEHINQVFDPFFTTKDIGKGLGLGLSISYGIVEDFGGEIHAENRPERGARLTLTLPRFQQSPASQSAAAHA